MVNSMDKSYTEQGTNCDEALSFMDTHNLNSRCESTCIKLTHKHTHTHTYTPRHLVSYPCPSDVSSDSCLRCSFRRINRSVDTDAGFAVCEWVKLFANTNTDCDGEPGQNQHLTKRKLTELLSIHMQDCYKRTFYCLFYKRMHSV